MTVQKNGREVFNDSDINNPDIDGGTIDNATITGGSITGITDLVVADGGTGASTLTDHGVLLGSGTDPITPMTALGAGELVVGVAGADPHALAAGATTKILVGGGAADPVWTEATGTGAPVRAISPTLVTPILGTPASGDLQNCTAATTTTKGVTVYSGNTKALAGTDTASAMTPADTAAAQAVLAREPDQGVSMTYAASGSSGITVADNDNIDFGTGNFTLVWKGSLPDWTPSAALNFLYKLQDVSNYITFSVETNGTIKTILRTGGANVFSGASSVAASNTDGTRHEIVVSVTRESASVAGSVVYYVDGYQLGTSQTITAAAPADLTNTGVLYISGTSSVRYASTIHHAYTFNRALTAAEVLDLYRNGIAESDKYGNQTALVINATDNMAADNAANWTPTGATVAFDTDHYELTSAGGGTGTLECACSGLTVGKKYRWDIKIKNGTDSLIVCTPLIRNNADDTTIATGTAGTTGAAFATVSVEWTATEANNLVKLSCASMTDTNNIELDDSAVYRIGATLALEEEGIQPAPGQWLDSSSNKLHAMQPATGSSLTRRKKDFEYRWTNTWTASSAAQYVGGLNQNVLSADHFITDIITQATVTTDVENLELGDGSAVAKFVAAFTPSATRTKHTIAAQNDGTNLKLVYTPAAEATMTVETIIRGFIWEP